MGSLRSRIASTRVKLQERQRRKEEKELAQLQKQRNSDLLKAKQYLAKAEARESAKDAALKKSQAKARLNAASNRRGRALASQLSRGGKVLFKSLRSAGEGLIEQKPARRVKHRKKATKKRR